MEPKINYIGIDIAKETHYVQTYDSAFKISNDKTGFAKLLGEVEKRPNSQVILEASGGYERELTRFMQEHDLSYSQVNPARVRNFARSEGLKAKNDPIDAKLLMHFAQEKKPKRTIPPAKNRQKLAELMDRRSHLSEQVAREKNRLEKQPQYTQSSIKRMIKLIDKEIDRINKAINKLIASDRELDTQNQIMQSVRGVGPVTAWSLLAYLPELAFINRNQAVALTGIAPFDRDTGKSKGRRRIIAGRAKIRKALYMAAQTAAIHNPVIKVYVDRLKSKGKPYKCAIVAAMRKLLIHLQSLVKNYQFCLD